MAGPFKYIGDQARVVRIEGADLLGPLVAQATSAADAASNDAIAAAASAASATGAIVAERGTLYKLKRALVDPLTQEVNIALLGDSITWGWTVTGQATSDPRTGALSDPRNNATSPSWANLLHAYLGREFYEDATVTASAWAGTTGVAIFEYSKTLDLFPGYTPFSATNTNTATNHGTWTIVANSGTALGYYLNGLNALSSDNLRLSFQFTGSEFTLVFASLADGAKYELLVNGVSEGIFSTQNGDLGLTTAFGRTRLHTLSAFARDATIELRVIPGDVNRKTLRIGAIRIERKLRVTNQGIIGTDADRYNSELMPAALQSDDTFALIQLGTNDRGKLAASGYAMSMNALRTNMVTLLDQVEAAGAVPIILCANAVTNNTKPTYAFDMSDVRAVLRRLAMDRQVSFIDQFAITRPLIAAGDTTWTADGTHPNDSGHTLLYKNLRAAIDDA